MGRGLVLFVSVCQYMEKLLKTKVSVMLPANKEQINFNGAHTCVPVFRGVSVPGVGSLWFGRIMEQVNA